MTDEQAAQLIEQNKKLLDKIAALESRLQQKEALIAALLKRLYGAKSEKLSQDQLLLTFLEDEALGANERLELIVDGNEEPPAASHSPQKKRAKRTNKLSDSLKDLPTTERIIIDPEVKKNPDLFRLIGEELSERLHINPATFTREIIKRLTHVRKGDPDAIPITPPLEPCLLPGSVLTPSLGAHLLTEKFCYHQPFYRQEWRLRATHGIELTRNLMCSWHNHLADRLLPLYDLMAGSCRQSNYLRIDDWSGTTKTAQRLPVGDERGRGSNPHRLP